MGYEKDEPRPGFDHWISFKGQGPYFNPELNINGKRERVEGYTNDILNDRAAEWIRQRGERPFLAYVSHKAVHNPRTPATTTPSRRAMRTITRASRNGNVSAGPAEPASMEDWCATTGR